ncbi:MAG: CoA ester lyase, partial [Nocardiopsaceae bacterium]|nr:CoA ester lyase [Nocardiopsaceae bacterium]
MPQTYRSRRSCLAVPASSPRFLAKSRELAADEVMLDLEDAVAETEKTHARPITREAVGRIAADVPVAVRVNGVESG